MARKHDRLTVVKSLLKHVPKGEPVYLQMSTKVPLIKLSPPSKGASSVRNPVPVMIKLAKPWKRQRILLVVKDPQQSAYSVLQEDKEACTYGMFDEIISVSKLRARKGRKQLLQEFDLVVVDDRVAKVLPPILGAEFYKSGKHMPVPIVVHPPSDKKKVDPVTVKKQTRLASKSTALALTDGTLGSMQVGFSDMGAEDLAENIETVIQGIMERLGSMSRHVSGFQIKTADSASLPLN